ncbi:MAG TPA: LysR family transcriptional regulator [Kofleriaceae bacterium]|nr:LysR family transcriptional regulator [Kofleriaceae bacterium]
MTKSHDPERLEVRHLRLVRAIADEGSVTRAAGRLHLSQSAVSHQLLDLERDLGTRLFDRIGKRMVATSAGTRLIEAAARLLGELAELERALDGTKRSRVPLRVTTSCFTSYHWLPAALSHFASAHPEVEIEVVIEATRRAVPALAADEVDLAIVTDPPRDDGWRRELVIDSELVALASPDHPVIERVRRGALRWSALRDHELLVYDISDADYQRLDTAVREAWRHESGERLASPVAVRKVPLSEALLELVRTGNGIGIVDRWTVAPHLGRGLRALPLSPHASRLFYAVWRRGNPRELPIPELLDVIRKAGQRVLVRGSQRRQ